ncbi:MAG: S41 family peptidase [Spirosomataceae bacterium]
MQKGLILLLILGSLRPVFSQTFSTEQVQSDFRFLRRMLEEAHPGLYRYTSKDSMNRAFDRVFQQLNRPFSEKELFCLWSPLLAAIRCGHTYLIHSQAFDAQKNDTYWLPFQSRVIGSRLFVRELGKNCSDSTLVRGTEILRINDLPVGRLIETARQSCSADGDIQTFKDSFLELYRLEETLNDYFGIRAPYRFSAKSPSGERRESLVFNKYFPQPNVPEPPLSPQDVRGRERDALEKLRHFKLLPQVPETLLMTCNGFRYDDFKTFNQQVFQTARTQNIQHLIIDLRQNPGGDTANGDDILRYLLTQPIYNFLTYDTPVRQLFFAEQVAPTPKDYLFSPKQLQKQPNGTYRRTRNGIQRLTPYAALHFSGQVYVLIGGYTFSAGALLAGLLKAHTNAIFIGQETGGSEAGCNGGLTSKVILPHTRMVVNFPHFRIETNTQAPDTGRGVMPHYPIQYTASDIASGRDLELEKAVELILRK